jgi:hypothetical protein
MKADLVKFIDRKDDGFSYIYYFEEIDEKTLDNAWFISLIAMGLFIVFLFLYKKNRYV